MAEQINTEPVETPIVEETAQEGVTVVDETTEVEEEVKEETPEDTQEKHTAELCEKIESMEPVISEDYVEYALEKDYREYLDYVKELYESKTVLDHEIADYLEKVDFSRVEDYYPDLGEEYWALYHEIFYNSDEYLEYVKDTNDEFMAEYGYDYYEFIQAKRAGDEERADRALGLTDELIMYPDLPEASDFGIETEGQKMGSQSWADYDWS